MADSLSNQPPIDRYCPKCTSNRVYVDGDFYACRTCGNRWTNIKPLKKTGDEEMPKATLDADKIKTMITEGNSFPEIITATGYNKYSVRSFMKREGLKCDKDGRSGNRRIKKSPKNINEVKKHAKALVIKHNGGNPDTAGIVASINTQIEYHQDMIGKLEQAKQILL